MKNILTCCAVMVSVMQGIAFAQITQRDAQEMLTRWSQSIYTFDKADIARLTTNDLPTLAEFLNTSLGFRALHGMEAIDANASLPYFISALPKSYGDGDVSRDICKALVSHSRDAAFPGQQARTSLLAVVTSRKSWHYYNHILALGAVGHPEDILLIKSLYEQHAGDYRAEDATRWALARLGDRDSLMEMARRMRPPDPSADGYRTVDYWNRWSQEVQMYDYVRRDELFPVLRDNLLATNVSPPGFECFVFFPPPQMAALVLAKAVAPSIRPEKPMEPASWKSFLDKAVEKLAQQAGGADFGPAVGPNSAHP